MYIVSHIALFYFFGKAIKSKKIWSGMIASIFPDILLIINWICITIGLKVSLGSSHPLNLFLHSIFPLFFLLPLLFIEKWYFYSTAMGYSFHLFLDYLTHTTIRMPLYPILNWKISIFLISYLNPTFILITNAIICILFLAFIGNKIIKLLKNLLNMFQKERVILIVILYIIIASILGILYALAVIKSDTPIFFIFIPLVIINLFFIGIVFLIEMNHDKILSHHLNKLLNRLLLSKISVPSR